MARDRPDTACPDRKMDHRNQAKVITSNIKYVPIVSYKKTATFS